MDLLAKSYTADDDDGPQHEAEDQNLDNSSPDSSPTRIALPSKSSAPKVDDTTLALAIANTNDKPIDPIQHVVPFNPTYDQLWAPIYGPAHPYAKDEESVAGKKEGLQTELTEEQKKYAEEYAKKKGEEKGAAEKGEFVTDKSTFHGKEERDYQGRSWIAPPKDAKATNDHSGMDTKVKIWDVFNSGKCMRTYMGHSKAVRDISFCNDGTKFLTAGYDKNIKYWDTETGQVISTFSTGKIPYVVKLNPDDDKQNILLAGMSDKKIVQWDMNTGQITQEYDQHLGAVNTITFVDNNRRFVTSSDDKSLRVWEFGIPVVIKYISEPHMHSMPSISLHPNTNWLAAQSLDNQILIYSTRERFQLNKKKRFAGHIAAGYACQVNFSPDGRFVMSGDGEGKCWFWDWKSCKVFRTLKCHEGVCIGCEWHPLEQSKVATCGWDGLIKYW
ncbi:Pre-mRNA-processing factor 17 [Vitis vinifera]|uniref:Pre-mRNA-processing factor 17 n=1 Tax=Vitis vinifera TaxID=29760 RepID=A0A438EHW1_VITVI|nr:Pre-mRNA-processing factor 17 [Vitis vinifera]